MSKKKIDVPNFTHVKLKMCPPRLPRHIKCQNYSAPQSVIIVMSRAAVGDDSMTCQGARGCTARLKRWAFPRCDGSIVVVLPSAFEGTTYGRARLVCGAPECLLACEVVFVGSRISKLPISLQNRLAWVPRVDGGRCILRRDEDEFEACFARARADKALSKTQAVAARKLCYKMIVDSEELLQGMQNLNNMSQWYKGGAMQVWYPRVFATMEYGPLAAGLRGFSGKDRLYDFSVPPCVTCEGASTAEPRTKFVPSVHVPWMLQTARLLRSLQDLAVVYMRSVRAPVYGLSEVPPAHELEWPGEEHTYAFVRSVLPGSVHSMTFPWECGESAAEREAAARRSALNFFEENLIVGHEDVPCLPWLLTSAADIPLQRRAVEGVNGGVNYFSYMVGSHENVVQKYWTTPSRMECYERTLREETLFGGAALTGSMWTPEIHLRVTRRPAADAVRALLLCFRRLSRTDASTFADDPMLPAPTGDLLQHFMSRLMCVWIDDSTPVHDEAASEVESDSEEGPSLF